MREMETKGISQDALREKLGEDMNMKLFETRETGGYTDFLINERILTAELYDFLSQQFALYAREDAVLLSEFAKSLRIIKGNSESYQALLRLADEKSLPSFQSSVVHNRLSLNPIKEINYDAHIFLFCLEGKIIMEGYARFLRYIETLIRNTGIDYEISGAVRAFIE